MTARPLRSFVSYSLSATDRQIDALVYELYELTPTRSTWWRQRMAADKRIPAPRSLIDHNCRPRYNEVSESQMTRTMRRAEGRHAMEHELEVVVRNGALVPLKPLGLKENQRLKITLHLPAEKRAADALAAWQQVYEGLSDADVSEVEVIARDREHFMPQRD